jgi:hypothetical protein
MAQIQTSTRNAPKSTGQLTAVAASNFALGVGWGGAAVFALTAGSTDRAGQFTITASTTTPAQATATVVFTFADGAFEVAPIAIITTTNTNSLTAASAMAWTATTTALTMTHSILPVDTKVYTFNYVLIG